MDYLSALNGGILYYPSIEFPNTGFIKSALCIWDTIYRIVPESYNPEDSEEIETAVKEGVIKNIKLTNKDLMIAANGFMDFITGTQFIPAGLDGHDEIDLHKDKVDARLYPYLRELSRKVTGDWITLSKEVVHGYMLFLANSICQNRNMPKITDNSDVFAIMTYFENDGNFDESVLRNNADEYYSTIIVPTLIPAGVERTDIDLILRFREKTLEGRGEFRNTVSKFTDELKKVEDKDYAQDLTYNFVKNLNNSKKNIIEAGKEVIKNLIPSLLTVGVPTTISTLGLLSAYNNPFTTTNIMDSVSIGSIAALADGYNKSKTWKSKTASYYFGLKGTFDDEIERMKAPRLDRVFEEFIND